MATSKQDLEQRLVELVTKLEDESLTFDQFNKTADEALEIVATFRKQLSTIEEKINTYQESVSKK